MMAHKKTLFLLLLLFCNFANAQQVLKGIITDAVTGKPVAAASVFLSNTSKGTVTDSSGHFTLYRFPDGKFDVVVSCLGYETNVQAIESANIPAMLAVRLKQKVNELQEVVIGGTDKLSWKDWGPFFIKHFIGTSDLANHCNIINTKAIELRRNKKTGNITASADEPLLIENKSLGYTIRYQLEQFEYDSKTHFLFFAGYPLFEAMTSDRKKTTRRWEQNRQEAYYGSQLHFLRAVYQNKLAAEKFEVRRLKKIPNREKERVRKIYAVYALNNPAKIKDSSGYYDRILSEPDEKSYLDTRLLSGDSIAYATDSVTLFVSFPDYLYIIYKNKKEPVEYLSQTLQRRSAANISSDIRLTQATIQVFHNGSYYPGTAIVTDGFWGWWEKISSMLPFDYYPQME